MIIASTTTTLESNGSYTSSILDGNDAVIINQYIVSISTDTNGTLFIYSGSILQSLTLTNTTVVDMVNVITKTVKIIVPAETARYFRFIYTNGDVAQTFFSFMIYNDISATTIQLNNAIISTTNPMVTSSVDLETQTPNDVALNHSQLVAEFEPQINAVFLGSLSPYQWTQATAGGTISTSGGVVYIKSAAVTNNSTMLTSAKKARYFAGQANRFTCGVIVDNIAASGVRRRWGAFDDNNGFFFELNNGILYTVQRKDTIDNRQAQSIWSNPTVFTLGTNFVGYNIDYSTTLAIYYINNIKAHVVVSSKSSIVNGPASPVRFQTENTISTSINSLGCRAVAILRQGVGIPRPHYLYISDTITPTATIKHGPGTLRRVIVNEKGASGTTLKLYDAITTSPTSIIASINLANNLGSMLYDLDFNDGLTYESTGKSTVKSYNVTIVYD